MYALLRTATVLKYWRVNVCGLLFKRVREHHKERFATCITISYLQILDSVLHGGQKVTSLPAELQGNLSRFTGGTVG